MNDSREPQRDPAQKAYAAIEKLLRKAKDDKVTGKGTVTVDFNGGFPRMVKMNLEEVLQPS